MSAVNVYQVNCCANLFSPASFKYFCQIFFFCTPHSYSKICTTSKLLVLVTRNLKFKFHTIFHFTHSLKHTYWWGKWYIQYYYFGEHCWCIVALEMIANVRPGVRRKCGKFLSVFCRVSNDTSEDNNDIDDDNTHQHHQFHFSNCYNGNKEDEKHKKVREEKAFISLTRVHWK